MGTRSEGEGDQVKCLGNRKKNKPCIMGLVKGTRAPIKPQ